MKEAIELSEKAMRSNEGGPFGCVIVKNDKIIGRGSNQVNVNIDPTAHAEMVAIRDACRTWHHLISMDVKYILHVSLAHALALFIGHARKKFIMLIQGETPLTLASMIH
ncbi:MAG: nucleoside deaminase [Ginsengibacter sp.]